MANHHFPHYARNRLNIGLMSLLKAVEKNGFPIFLVQFPSRTLVLPKGDLELLSVQRLMLVAKRHDSS